ncbi:hypothetical protein ACFTQ7_13315 [Lysinibacillus sp. NPDC056959]|uniref:hypothetical protein n=1 Tax=Lysinibacillus sp. NPDC056959 TaxID=3345981 RepID=UPI00362EAD44
MLKIFSKVIIAFAVLVTILLASLDTPYARETTSDEQIPEEQLPKVDYYNDINDYDEFIFESKTKGTEVPFRKWDWDNGSYPVNGSSNSGATLYTNFYFIDVVGKTFDFTAGSSNKITVDLVHKGFITQTVVQSWTITAKATKSVTIKKSDLGDKSFNGNYYFRFNSSPAGKSYSVSGTFE